MNFMKIFSFLLLLFFINTSNAQSYTNKTIHFDGEIREYKIYVPAIYDGSTDVPLIFNFHGGSGTIDDQIGIADMRDLADTANFIAVYPQALADPNDGGSTNWIHKDPTTVDDVNFIDALIDSIGLDYQIDQDRIYACGYSLGGEFTFQLGCDLNNKIAAIGVVARTMQTYTYNNCSPVHPTGVMTILGTDDGISNYEGVWWAGTQYYVSAKQMHTYWATHNNCDTVASKMNVPNTNTSDGSTVERNSWKTKDGCTYVQELKVIDGGHDWPGSFGNMDINATEEIWNFVSNFDINGIRNCQANDVEKLDYSLSNLSIYPNPTSGFLKVNINSRKTENFVIYSLLGEVVMRGYVNSSNPSINIQALPADIYIFKVGNDSVKLIVLE